MADSARIKDALAKLDVENDNHWTGDGLPRLDTVKLTAGDQSLTREAVTAAAPGFSRGTAAALAAPAVSQATATGSTAIAAPATVQPAAITVSVDEREAVLENADPKIAELQSKLEDRNEYMVELRAAKAKFDAEFVSTRDEIDRLTVQLESLAGKETAQDAIRGYLASQQALSAERAARIQAIRASGVDLRELTRGLKAPIDSAMSRKTSRGTQRPGS